MNTIETNEIHRALESAGFDRLSKASTLFLIDERSPITPAYYCNVIRKRGKARYSGGFGLYFRDFEAVWRDSLSSEEMRLDRTLPLIMAIENFADLNENGGLGYIEESYAALPHAYFIYDLCSRFPRSIADFDEALIIRSIMGKSVSEYLHIFKYLDNDNLYFKKSVSFVRWLTSKWPETGQHLIECMTDFQREKIH